MSLISDALKKAQQERDKNQPYEDSPTEPVQLSSSFPKKRLIFYGGLLAVIIVVVLVVTVFYKPQSKPSMQALNVHSGPVESKPQTIPVTQSSNEQPPENKKFPVQSPEPEKTQTQPQVPIEKNERQSVSVITKKEPPVIQEMKPQVKIKDKPLKEALKKEVVKPKPIIKKPVSKPKTKITLQAEPTSLPIETGIDALIAKGDRLMDQKNPHMAAEQYKGALKIEKSVKLYLKLYYAFKAMKNSVLSRAYIDDGLKHFADDFYLNKISAILYIRARQYRNALENIKNAIKTNDGDYAVFTYQGLCSFHLKDYSNALTSFQTSLKLNSDALENYYYTGLIFDNQKKYAKALEYYNAFYKLNPDGKNFKHHKWVTRRIRLLQQYTD
jgi:Tetratricopeptide repeat